MRGAPHFHVLTPEDVERLDDDAVAALQWHALQERLLLAEERLSRREDGRCADALKRPLRSAATGSDQSVALPSAGALDDEAVRLLLAHPNVRHTLEQPGGAAPTRPARFRRQGKNRRWRRWPSLVPCLPPAT